MSAEVCFWGGMAMHDHDSPLGLRYHGRMMPLPPRFVPHRRDGPIPLADLVLDRPSNLGA
jgi:hypothetical protein